jgi:hypothetical protein
MNITGQFNYNFYPQTEINWSKDISPSEINGEYQFLFSGESGNDLVFKLKNNKIFSYNEDLLGGFRNNEIINFSGNVTKNSLDLYYNNIPLYLGLNRNGSGRLIGFSISSINSNVNFQSLNILGERPEILFDTNLLVNSTGFQFPVTIFNSGSDIITILSGESLDSNFTISGATNVVISPNSSSQIFLISDRVLSTELQIININLFTNFGTQNLFINLSGIEIIPSLFSISISPPETTIFNNSSLLYTLSAENSSGSNLEISLEYSSGITGDYFKNIFRTGFLSNAPISGFISGSGFINNIKTGFVSGFNILRNNFEFGTGSGIIRRPRIADDGDVYVFYDTIVTGFGDVDFIRNVIVTGFNNNIIYSGFVNYAGGNLTGNVFGFASGVNLDRTATGNISGSALIFQRWTGGIFAEFFPDEYQLTNFVSPLRFVTGNFSTGLSLFGLAFATGERITGKLIGDFGANDFEPGIYTFSKPFSGPVTGTLTEYTGFDPVGLSILNTQTTGLLDTILYKTVVAQGCEIDFGDLGETLPASGFPATVSRIRVRGTGVTFPIDIFQLLPLTSYIEWQYENSDQKLNSGNSYITKQIKFLYKTGILKSGFEESFINTGFYPTVGIDKVNENIYITRQNGADSFFSASIYNPLYQTDWEDNNWSNNDQRFLNTPAFTLWNKDGWNTRTGVHERNYTGFYYLYSNIGVFPNDTTAFRNAITGKELMIVIMLLNLITGLVAVFQIIFYNIKELKFQEIKLLY